MTLMTDTLSGTTLFSLNYTFGASGANNGNPSQVVGGGSGSGAGFTQNYFYGKLNRLCAAGEAAAVVTISTCPSSSGGGAPTTGVNWAQNLRYDQYGNMWQASQAGLSSVAALAWMPTAQSQIDATSNHLTVSGLAYDSGGGNQTTFLGTSTSSPIQYDAENRQVYVKDGLGNVFQYTYDGLGQRVSRQENSGTVTNYVHDVFGNLAAEYNPPSATACTTCYLSWDHLGSTRMVTDAGGNIVARHDYLPFGVELPRSWSVTDGLSPKFTGQDHDSETLLEFYQARYLAAGLGRFMSVDPGNAGADLTDPQSWNMYSYVRNSPLTFVDPSGLDDCDSDDGSCGDCDPDDPSCSGGGGGGGWPGGGGGGGTDPNNPNGYVPGVVYPSGPQAGPGAGVANNLEPSVGTPTAPVVQPPAVAPQPTWLQIIGDILTSALSRSTILLVATPQLTQQDEIQWLKTRPEAGPKWTCTASCNLQGIDENPVPFPRVTGTGSGPSEDIACAVAKHAATQSAPRGTYARHCQCVCSSR